MPAINKNNIFLAVIFCFSFLPAAHTYAADDLASIKSEIEAIQSDPERMQATIEQGKEAADFCQLCHGADGNAEKVGVPNLAQQNPVYLADQFNKFASGQREDFTGVMASLVNALSAEERVALAIYFSNASLKPLPYDQVKAKLGMTRFQRVCKLCHGEDGQGKEGYARIAGQKQDYVLDSLKLFRDRKIGKFRSRESSLMTVYVTGISDEELEQLAHYITSLAEKLQ